MVEDRVSLNGQAFLSFDNVTDGDKLKNLEFEWTIMFGLKLSACPTKDKQVVFSTGKDGYSLEVVP